MQIHEITLAQVNEALYSGPAVKSQPGAAPSKIPGAIKGAASSVASGVKNVGKGLSRAATAIGNTTPIKKAMTVMNTPGALTSPGGYASTMDKYYQNDNTQLQAQFDQQKSARLAAQTQQRAAQLAQQWIQQVQAKKSLPEAVAGTPTPAELAKYQQKVAAAANPKTGFGALPGSNLPLPGKVNPAVTAKPKTVMTGARANEFKAWVDKQLTSQVTGTNQTISMAQVRQDPAVAQQLAQLLPTIIMKNDPAAIEQYLTIAMNTMQKLSTKIRQSQKSANPNRSTSVSPLSMLISPDTIEKIKTMSQDPIKAAAIKQTFGLK